MSDEILFDRYTHMEVIEGYCISTGVEQVPGKALFRPVALVFKAFVLEGQAQGLGTGDYRQGYKEIARIEGREQNWFEGSVENIEYVLSEARDFIDEYVVFQKGVRTVQNQEFYDREGNEVERRAQDEV